MTVLVEGREIALRRVRNTRNAAAAQDQRHNIEPTPGDRIRAIQGLARRLDHPDGTLELRLLALAAEAVAILEERS